MNANEAKETADKAGESQIKQEISTLYTLIKSAAMDGKYELMWDSADIRIINYLKRKGFEVHLTNSKVITINWVNPKGNT